MWMRYAMISLGLAITFVQMILHQIGSCFLRVEELVTQLPHAIEGIVCVVLVAIVGICKMSATPYNSHTFF